MKFLTAILCAITLVVAVPNPDAPDAGTPACDGLIDLRPSPTGDKLCTNAAHSFKWDGSSPTITQGDDPKRTCDHVLELQLVKKVLDGGLCVPLKASPLDKAAKVAILQPIKDAVNNADLNLYRLTTSLESFKGNAFQKWIPTYGPIPTFPGGAGRNKALAGQDYLRKTGANSHSTALNIDAAITAGFTKLGKPHSGDVVATRWAEFLAAYDKAIPPPK